MSVTFSAPSAFHTIRASYSCSATAAVVRYQGFGDADQYVGMPDRTRMAYISTHIDILGISSCRHGCVHSGTVVHLVNISERIHIDFETR